MDILIQVIEFYLTFRYLLISQNLVSLVFAKGVLNLSDVVVSYLVKKTLSIPPTLNVGGILH